MIWPAFELIDSSADAPLSRSRTTVLGTAASNEGRCRAESALIPAASA